MTESIVSPCIISPVSSANSRVTSLVVQYCMSLIKSKKRSGPKTEPWGTPHAMGLVSDFVPFITVYWVLFVR